MVTSIKYDVSDFVIYKIDSTYYCKDMATKSVATSHANIIHCIQYAATNGANKKIYLDSTIDGASISQVTFDNGTLITGPSSDKYYLGNAVTLIADASLTTSMFFTNKNCVTVENIFFQGQVGSGNSEGGFKCVDNKGCIVRNCEFFRFDGNAIEIAGGAHIISSNHMAGNIYGYGIDCRATDTIITYNNIATDSSSGKEGIYINNGSNLISHNNVFLCLTNGIMCDTGGDGNIIVDNISHDNVQNGIENVGSENVITGNMCFNNSLYGIRSRGALNCINSNTCYDNGQAGITLQTGNRFSVSGNFCKDNGTDPTTNWKCAGILAYSVSSALITNNLCSGASWGIYEYSCADDENYIFNNLLTENDDGGYGVNTTSLSHFKNNYGYTTESSGTALASNGDTIAHGLVSTPSVVFLHTSNATHMSGCSIKDSTNLTVHLCDSTGVTVAVNELIYWRAEVL
jgi:hypothetical protein